MAIGSIVFIVLMSITGIGLFLYVIGEALEVKDGTGIKAIALLMIGFTLFPACSLLLWEWFIV